MSAMQEYAATARAAGVVRADVGDARVDEDAEAAQQRGWRLRRGTRELFCLWRCAGLCWDVESYYVSCSWGVHLTSAVGGQGVGGATALPLYKYKEDVDGQEGRAMEGRRRQNKEQRRRVAKCATIGEGGLERIMIIGRQ